MKYHPDRNPDDDDAKIAYQLVLTAYQTLVDIEKRKSYDSKLLGTSLPENPESKESTTSAVGDRPSFGIDNIGKVFGKAIQRLSIHKPSTLNSDIVEAAQLIAK